MIANCRPGIENPGSLRLGVIEQMRRIDVFHVEWRIFAHDDRIEVGQPDIFSRRRLAPPGVAMAVGAIDQFDTGGPNLDNSLLDIHVAHHGGTQARSEKQPSELQSPMRLTYDIFV